MITRKCKGKHCSNTFRVSEGCNQKYCSEYCSMSRGESRYKVHTDMTRKMNRAANRARKLFYYWSDREVSCA